MPFVTREVPPGSGRYRAVPVPDRDAHPRAAPGFFCAICGHPIGKARTHWILSKHDKTVACSRCWLRLPDDKRPHPGAGGTRAGVAAALGLWP